MLENKSGDEIFQRAISIRSSDASIKRRRSKNLSNGKVSLSKSTKETTVVAAQKEGTNLIAKEESAVGSVGMGIYIRYFKSIGLLYGILTIVCGIAHQAIQVYSNTWLSQWSAHPEANAPHIRDLYLGVYGGLGFAQGLFSTQLCISLVLMIPFRACAAIALFTSSLVLALGCLKAAGVLHHNLLRQIMRLPMAFFDTTPLGRIMNRFSKDVDVVDNLLPNVVRTWLLMFFNVCYFVPPSNNV